MNPAAKIRVVWAPDERTESLRDLTRAYYDALGASKRPKLQTSGFLLGHGHVWNERTKAGGLRKTWTADYMRWLRSIEFADRRERETFDFYVRTATEDIERRRRLARRCREEAESPEVKPYVDALCRLKGVDAIGALTHIASIGDFSRFRGGRAVSSYLGLTPKRCDSGPKKLKSGRITKAGVTTCRRALVEAMASVSRFGAGPKAAPKRGHEVSAAVETEALKCNIRISERYAALVRNGKAANVARVAVTSELARDMWVIGMIVRREAAGR